MHMNASECARMHLTVGSHLTYTREAERTQGQTWTDMGWTGCGRARRRAKHHSDKQGCDCYSVGAVARDLVALSELDGVFLGRVDVKFALPPGSPKVDELDAFCAVKLNGGVTLALGTPVTCDAACAPQRPRKEFYLALILRCFTQNSIEPPRLRSDVANHLLEEESKRRSPATARDATRA
jgi:hypothetical protein